MSSVVIRSKEAPRENFPAIDRRPRDFLWRISANRFDVVPTS